MRKISLFRPGDDLHIALRELCFAPVLVWSVRESGEKNLIVCPEGELETVRTIIARFSLDAEAVSEDGVTAGDVCGYADTVGGAELTSPSALAALERVKRSEIVSRHMDNGVFFIDPDDAYISPDVVIGRGTTVWPDVYLRGVSKFGRGCVIGAGCNIEDSTFGDGCILKYVQAVRSEVADGCDIGPYANLRPGTRVASHVHIGDFMELKNTTVGEKSKLSHFTYLGDADVGSGVNVACGVVTANYNGYKKNRTVIGDHAFIGCNTNLVAPVRVGDYGYTAAGSTITEDIPEGNLAVARARQTNKPGWVEKHRERNQG